MLSCDTEGPYRGKLRLKYTRWGDPSEMESTRELIAEFERENPNVKVMVDVVSWEQYWQKLKATVAAGTAQDVWLMSPAFVEEFAKNKHINDLMPFIKKDPDFGDTEKERLKYLEESYFPNAFNAFSYVGEGNNMHTVRFPGGKLYAFTRDYNCSILYYNRDHFDAAGLEYPNEKWTWDDLVEAAKKLTFDADGDGIIDQWGYGGLQYTNFARVCGGKFMDPEARTSTYDSPEVISALKFLWELIHVHKVHPPPSLRIHETGSFSTGKTAMSIAGVWNIRANNDSKYLWDIAPIPRDRLDRPSGLSGGGMGHCMNANTKYPNMAWKLIKFLSSEISQRSLARSGTSVPVLRKAAQSEDFLADFDRPPRKSYPVIWKSLSGRYSPSEFTLGYTEYMRLARNEIDTIWQDENPEGGAEAMIRRQCRKIDAETRNILIRLYGKGSK